MLVGSIGISAVLRFYSRAVLRQPARQSGMAPICPRDLCMPCVCRSGHVFVHMHVSDRLASCLSSPSCSMYVSGACASFVYDLDVSQQPSDP